MDEQSRHVERVEEKIRAEEKEKSERQLSIIIQEAEEELEKERKQLAQYEKDRERARAEWELKGKQLNKEVEKLRGELSEKDAEQDEAQEQWSSHIVKVERPLIDQRNRVDDIMEHELRELVTPHALAASARGARACALDVRRDATGGGARLRQR